jgi:N-acetylglucosaminyldiphosphoundecaprenol N-acetyl-beta-D-mannosaminyltransferase
VRRRFKLGPLSIDPVTRDDALRAVEELVIRGEGGAVFTPNVDHIMLADENPRMQAAYARASLSLADGMPVLWASRLLGEPLPAKVSGSDFVPALLAHAAERGWRVYFLGGAPGVAALARDKLLERLPRLQVVGVDVSRIDADEAPDRWRPLVERIRATRPDLIFVALGAPKQEIWIDTVREELRPSVLLAVGGSLDFIAGTVPRAPQWVSRSGFEWLFRLSLEPRRLWRRYLLRDPKFALLLGRALIARARDRAISPGQPR